MRFDDPAFEFLRGERRVSVEQLSFEDSRLAETPDCSERPVVFISGSTEKVHLTSTFASRLFKPYVPGVHSTQITHFCECRVSPYHIEIQEDISSIRCIASRNYVLGDRCLHLGNARAAA